MQLFKFIQKYNIHLIISILFIILYGILQINTTSVLQKIIFDETNFIEQFIIIFTKIFIFFSGFLTVFFITLITNICYDFIFDLDVSKKNIFILSSFGYFLYFLFYIGIHIFLQQLNYGYEMGEIIAENIKMSSEFQNIQFLTKIFNLIYYIYMVIGMSFLVKDKWTTSLKYSIVLSLIYIIQNFVLNKG